METLKEYLVKIVGKSEGINELNVGIKNLTKQIMMAMVGFRSLSSAMMKIANVVKANIKETINLNDSLEETAKGLKKTTTEARAHQIALSAMGKTLQEINKDKELKATYDELIKIGKAFEFKEAPKGVTRIKDLQTEFTKIKFSLKMGLSQVYEWFKIYASKPLLQLRNMLKDFAEKLNLKIGELTKQVGEWLAKRLKDIIELGMRLAAVAKQLWNWGTRLTKWLSTMSDGMKAFAVAAVAAIAMITGKLKPLHMLLTAVYLLVEDFAVWMQGGKSFFGDSWQTMVNLFEKLGDFLDNDLGKITTLAGVLGLIFGGKDFAKSVGSGVLSLITTPLGELVVTLGGIAAIVALIYAFLNHSASGDAEDYMQMKQATAKAGWEWNDKGGYEGSWAEFTNNNYYDSKTGKWVPLSEDPYISAGNAYASYVNGTGASAGDKTVTANTTVNISVQGSNAMAIAQNINQAVASVIAQNVQGALA